MLSPGKGCSFARTNEKALKKKAGRVVKNTNFLYSNGFRILETEYYETAPANSDAALFGGWNFHRRAGAFPEISGPRPASRSPGGFPCCRHSGSFRFASVSAGYDSAGGNYPDQLFLETPFPAAYSVPCAFPSGNIVSGGDSRAVFRPDGTLFPDTCFFICRFSDKSGASHVFLNRAGSMARPAPRFRSPMF